MNYKQIAAQIPKEYRDEILKTNMISTAVGIATDNTMHYLHTIWKNYVEPGVGNCNVCYETVLKNYRELQQSMVELKKSEDLLDKLKMK